MKNSMVAGIVKGTVISVTRKASLYINDKDLFILFCKTDAYIRAFEMEYAFQGKQDQETLPACMVF